MRTKTRATILMFVTLFAGLAYAPFASATGLQARLGITFVALVSGDQKPAIVLVPSEAVRSVAVKLDRSDGTKSAVRSGAIAAGAEARIAIAQPVGQFAYKAHFDVVLASGETGTLDMDFSLTRVDKLKLDLVPADVDLDGRTLSFKINNPAAKATLEIYGQDGQKLKTIESAYQGAQGGTSLTIAWSDPGPDVLYLDLKVYDIAGFWKGVRLTPFHIDIPHDEVEFESGKSEIRVGEEPKLKKTLSLIRDALAKHGQLLELRLYIAGYTDTVGSKGSNDLLSNNRARSIAAWYRNNGLKIPIFSQGFGETVLAKPTPDETPEAANRRAVYILSSQAPMTSKAMPQGAWKPL
ncbi:MAG: OmpA family protein [Myxococcales bacterium]|nr:OmpA family protein [Myxococcales bacterium]